MPIKSFPYCVTFELHDQLNTQGNVCFPGQWIDKDRLSNSTTRPRGPDEEKITTVHTVAESR
jgi:quinol monooxygenase YgiN